MTVLVLACGALGMLLVFLGLTSPPPASRIHRFAVRLGLEAGYPKLGAVHVVMICTATVLLAGTVTAALTSSVVVAVVAAGAGLWAPIAWLRGRARRRRRAHREVWAETIALISSGVRAGVSLPEVLCSLADRGPDVLRPHFYAFRSHYRSTNSFNAALGQLVDRMADPVADRVAVALQLAHDLGGTDLVRVLRALGDFVRDDLRTRKEVEARWAWTVTAARLAAAAPWIVLVGMSSRPEAAAAYDSAGGTILVICGAAATLIGYRLMLRAARLPDEPRWSS